MMQKIRQLFERFDWLKAVCKMYGVCARVHLGLLIYSVPITVMSPTRQRSILECDKLDLCGNETRIV